MHFVQSTISSMKNCLERSSSTRSPPSFTSPTSSARAACPATHAKRTTRLRSKPSNASRTHSNASTPASSIGRNSTSPTRWAAVLAAATGRSTRPSSKHTFRTRSYANTSKGKPIRVLDLDSDGSTHSEAFLPGRRHSVGDGKASESKRRCHSSNGQQTQHQETQGRGAYYSSDRFQQHEDDRTPRSGTQSPQGPGRVRRGPATLRPVRRTVPDRVRLADEERQQPDDAGIVQAECGPVFQAEWVDFEFGPQAAGNANPA